jgi:hypothetical protein
MIRLSTKIGNTDLITCLSEGEECTCDVVPCPKCGYPMLVSRSRVHQILDSGGKCECLECARREPVVGTGAGGHRAAAQCR